MAVLNCVKPGAKQGQIILTVDLSIAGNSDTALETLKSLGYEPTIQHVNYRDGVHVHAFLKNEQYETIPDDYLSDEWMALRESISPDAIHLWIGQ